MNTMSLLAAVFLTWPLSSPFEPAEASEKRTEVQSQKGETESVQGDDPTQASSVESDRDGANSPRVWYEEIVISATRGESSLGTIPLVSNVVEGSQIRNSPDPGLLDLIRQDPGITFRSDPNGLVAQPRDQAPSMRGLGGNSASRTLALVDGTPLADTYAGSVVWSQVPMEFVDRVEIVRGGGSSIWGNLALSGVINLLTKAPSDRQLQAKVRVGSKAARAASASYADSAGPWAGWVGLSYLDSDGYFEVPKDERLPISEPEKRQYEALTGKLFRTVSGSSSLTLGATVYNEDREEGTPLDRGVTEERRATASFDSVRPSGSSWRTSMFFRDTLTLEPSGSTPRGDEPQEPFSDLEIPSESFGLSGQWFAASEGRHSATVGADLMALSIERDQNFDWDGSKFTKNYFVSGQQRMAGLFVQDRITPTDRLSLLFTGRYDWIETYDGESTQTDKLTGETIREDLLEDNTETSFNPTVGFVYAASPASRIRGAAYTGFRAATPSELFVGFISNRSVNYPNPSLKPESLLGGEVGYDFTSAGGLTVRLTLFWNEIEDLIQRVTTGRPPEGGGVVEPCGFVPDGRSCTQRRNVGLAASSGLEIEGEYRPATFWRLRLAASFLESEVKENPVDPELVGNRLPLQADERLTLGITYNNPRILYAQLRGRYIGERFSDVENTARMSSYYVVDLALSRSLSERWQVFAGVENLLDETYATQLDRSGTSLGAPRLYHVGLRFGR
jgi:outer membrane receptor protein involved in Fe transport